MHDLEIEALKLFELTPSSYCWKWQIAADWLQDKKINELQLEMFIGKINAKYGPNYFPTNQDMNFQLALSGGPYWFENPNENISCGGVSGRGGPNDKIGYSIVDGTRPLMKS